MKHPLNFNGRLGTLALAICLGLVGLILILTTTRRSIPVPTVIGAVKLSSRPYKVAMNPDTGTAYVLHTNNSVSILQGTQLSDTISFSQYSLSQSGPVVVQPHTGRVYVFDSLYHLIRVIEPDGAFTTIQDPSFKFRGAVANPVTGHVYAINLWDREEDGQAIGGSVLVITGAEVIARVPMGRSPSTLAVNPANGLVYVGHNLAETRDYNQVMAVISGTQVIATSDMGQQPGTGGGVADIIVDPRTGQVFVSMNQRIFALRDLKPVKEKMLDQPALELKFNPVDRRLYAMMYDEVTVLDTNLNVIEHILLKPKRERSGNRSMAVDPVRGYVYVGSINDGTLTVIHDTKVITTLQVGWWTTDIGVDARTGLVYAVNNMSGDVTVVGFPEE